MIIHSRNSFSHKGRISKRLGSSTVLLWKPSTDFKMKVIFFGSYAMVYTGTTNTSNRRSIPSIALRESNEYGGHLLMSLYIGKEMHINVWVYLLK